MLLAPRCTVQSWLMVIKPKFSKVAQFRVWQTTTLIKSWACITYLLDYHLTSSETKPPEHSEKQLFAEKVKLNQIFYKPQNGLQPGWQIKSNSEGDEELLYSSGLKSSHQFEQLKRWKVTFCPWQNIKASGKVLTQNTLSLPWPTPLPCYHLEMPWVPATGFSMKQEFSRPNNSSLLREEDFSTTMFIYEKHIYLWKLQGLSGHIISLCSYIPRQFKHERRFKEIT